MSISANAIPAAIAAVMMETPKSREKRMPVMQPIRCPTTTFRGCARGKFGAPTIRAMAAPIGGKNSRSEMEVEMSAIVISGKLTATEAAAIWRSGGRGGASLVIRCHFGDRELDMRTMLGSAASSA